MNELTYAVEQRLRFIDFLLGQYGSVNRTALVDYFGISTPCASMDFAKYMAIAPENITYDKSAKAYVTSANFKRVWS
jgi:hypothetical protein